jgi:hypothetical protein
VKSASHVFCWTAAAVIIGMTSCAASHACHVASNDMDNAATRERIRDLLNEPGIAATGERIRELLSDYQRGSDVATIELYSIYGRFDGEELDYVMDGDHRTARQVILDVIDDYRERTANKAIDEHETFEIARAAARGEPVDLDELWMLFVKYVNANEQCPSWGFREYHIMINFINTLCSSLRLRGHDMDIREYIRTMNIIEWVYIASQKTELKDQRVTMMIHVNRYHDVFAMGTLARFSMAETENTLRDELWKRVYAIQLDIASAKSVGRDFSVISRDEIVEMENYHSRDVKGARRYNRIIHLQAVPERGSLIRGSGQEAPPPRSDNESDHFRPPVLDRIPSSGEGNVRN